MDGAPSEGCSTTTILAQLSIEPDAGAGAVHTINACQALRVDVRAAHEPVWGSAGPTYPTVAAPYFSTKAKDGANRKAPPVGLALMGVEKIVIEDIRHLLETAVEVLHLQEGFYSNRTDFIRTAIRNQLATHADAIKQSIGGTPIS